MLQLGFEFGNVRPKTLGGLCLITKRDHAVRHLAVVHPAITLRGVITSRHRTIGYGVVLIRSIQRVFKVFLLHTVSADLLDCTRELDVFRADIVKGADYIFGNVSRIIKVSKSCHFKSPKVTGRTPSTTLRAVFRLSYRRY